MEEKQERRDYQLLDMSESRDTHSREISSGMRRVHSLTEINDATDDVDRIVVERDHFFVGVR